MSIYKKKIQIPIYNQEINFIAGERHECLKYLEDLYKCDLSTWDVSENYAITLRINCDIWVFFDPVDFSLGAIVHELGHATYEIMNFIGLQLSDQEAFCYLQQFIFEEILDELPLTITYKNIKNE